MNSNPISAHEFALKCAENITIASLSSVQLSYVSSDSGAAIAEMYEIIYRKVFEIASKDFQ